jgi:secreted trypsin-like serine protease
VSPEYVLTAAHCINNNFRAYGGYEIGAYCSQTDNCGQNEESFDVRQIIVHPDYNRTELLDNDFALVRLSGISTITPVNMDGDGVSLSNGYSAGELVSAIGK